MRRREETQVTKPGGETSYSKGLSPPGNSRVLGDSENVLHTGTGPGRLTVIPPQG
jgi:hypothetical protein